MSNMCYGCSDFSCPCGAAPRETLTEPVRLVNLTPHAIGMAWPDVYVPFAEIQPSGTVCRVSTRPGSRGRVVGVSLDVYGPTTYGEVVGLPDFEWGTYYIVSAMVASALVALGVSRRDVLVPGTGPDDDPLRDGIGRIIAVRRLIRATH